MAWNRIGNFAALSLAFIFAACGGDSGSNASNDDVNSSTSTLLSAGDGNSVSSECSLGICNETVTSSASLEIDNAKYVFEYFENFMKGNAKGEKDGFIANKALSCQTAVGISNNQKMQEYQLKVVHNQLNNQQEILQEPVLEVFDSVQCLCNGTSWSIYVSSTNSFYYCDRNASGTWIWRPIQSGDGVAIRKDGLAYKTYVDNRDGNAYAIGLVWGKIWMLQDLRYDTGFDNYCYYSYNANNYADTSEVCELGRRYSEKAALGADGAYSNNGLPIQGICPQGWHVPDTSEWVASLNPEQSNKKNIHNYYYDELYGMLNHKTNWNEYRIVQSVWRWSSTYNEKHNFFYQASWGTVGNTYPSEFDPDPMIGIVGVRCLKNDDAW